ncbi:MAG TPA: hypothetical protein VGL89_16075 [Candidatus Koribacter sp.]|jgi:hypothetical protein
MKRLVFILALIAAPLFAQVPKGAENNASLRYWNAFAQMSDQPLSSAEAQHMEGVAKGTVPWDEAAVGKLLDQNAGAVETMVHGTTFPYCVWGIDYWGNDKHLVAASPIPDLGRGRALARLNILAARRLAAQGKSREATDHLVAGIRFAQDLGAGMPLIGVLVGAYSLDTDLTAALQLARDGKLSREDRARLKAAVRALKPDVYDWSGAIHLEKKAMMESLLQVKNAQDPLKLLAFPENKEFQDLNEAVRTNPRPSDADMREADAIWAKAEVLFRQPAASSAPGFDQLQGRIEKLGPLCKMGFPSLKRMNDERQTRVEDVLKKFQNEM